MGREVGRGVERVGDAGENVYNEGDRFVNKYGKTIVIVAAAAAITYFSAGTMSGLGAAMVQGAIFSATMSAGAVYVNGGSNQEIFDAALSGGVQGAAMGGVGYGVSGVTAMKHLLGAANGYISTGGSDEGMLRGFAASFIPADMGATNQFNNSKIANLALRVASDATRGYIIDGDEGMKMQVVGGLANQAIGHGVGFFSSGSGPEFQDGQYFYDSQYKGSFNIGGVMTLGTDSWMTANSDEWGKIRIRNGVLIDHERKHFTEQNTLGPWYLPVHAPRALGIESLEKRPFHSNQWGGGY